MKFRYEALDGRGRPDAGVVEAATAVEAGDVLAARGLFVERVVEDKGESRPATAGFVQRLGANKSRLVANFARDLAVLVNTGTALIDALNALERQCRYPPFAEVVGSVRGKVEDGSTLAEALEGESAHFDSVFRSLVAAGEAAGNIGEMLERVAVFTERQAKTRSAVLGSMAYPCVLLVIATGVLVSMFVFVLPRFAGLFESLDVALPASTEAMLMVSGVLKGYWWALLIVLIGGGGAGVWQIRTARGRRAAMGVALRLPMIGKLLKDFALARISRVLGILVQSSVPFLEALELTRKGVSNPAYAELLDDAEEGVMQGEPISAAFSRSDLASPAFVEALRAGEQSGRIGPVLSALADHLESDNEARLKTVTKLAEPIILAGLGVVVGVVAISLFLPLFDLTSMAGGAP